MLNASLPCHRAADQLHLLGFVACDVLQGRRQGIMRARQCKEPDVGFVRSEA
jgi:hypothetical protein